MNQNHPIHPFPDRTFDLARLDVLLTSDLARSENDTI